MPTLIALDDRRYASWLTDHPDGFVANVVRSGQPDYFVVHRCRCHTITPGSSRNNAPGAFTARAYRKVVARDLPELVAWGERHGFSDVGIRPCGICLPEAVLRRGHGRAFPDEVARWGALREGAVRRVEVNAIERSARARQACIDHHGTTCAVCAFDFGLAYPGLGEGFIHVHHLVDLAELEGETAVDPVRDLRPVCPNCHAMLHRTRPAMGIEALREIVQRGAMSSSRSLGG